MRKSCQPYNSTVRDHNNSMNATPKPPDASQRTIGLSNRTTYWLQLLRDKRENIRGERGGREGIQADWLVIIFLHIFPITIWSMPSALCLSFSSASEVEGQPLLLHRRPLSHSAVCKHIFINESPGMKKTPKHYAIDNLNTCCVFELHSIYAGAPISFLSSSP